MIQDDQTRLPVNVQRSVSLALLDWHVNGWFYQAKNWVNLKKAKKYYMKNVHCTVNIIIQGKYTSLKSVWPNKWQGLNPLTLMNDKDTISPNYINKISCRQVMRIKKSINYRIFNWSNSKFSKLTK